MNKVHVITMKNRPEATAPLAALFAATVGGTQAISGRTSKGDRERLAALVDDELAEVLRSPAPIRVQPRDHSTWTVIAGDGDPRADYALSRALREEMRRQDLSQSKLAERAGVPSQTLGYTLSTRSSPSWWLVKAILTGLGKDLRWLAEELDASNIQTHADN